MVMLLITQTWLLSIIPYFCIQKQQQINLSAKYGPLYESYDSIVLNLLSNSL